MSADIDDSKIPGNLFTEHIQMVLLRLSLLSAVIEQAKNDGDDRYQRLLPDKEILERVVFLRKDEVEQLRANSNVSTEEIPVEPKDQVVSVNPLFLRGEVPH